jgi:hypothetical protein
MLMGGQMASEMSDSRTLYERLGGYDVIARIVDSLVQPGVSALGKK